MSRQFQVIGVPLFDNENDRSSRKERSKYFKANETRRVNKMGIPEYGFEVHWGQRHRYVSWFPIQHSSYATLAKILEEITLFV
jgi:hypothetical protein